jgi:hypothetical protein
MGGLLAGLWQFQALQAEEKFADIFAPELSYYNNWAHSSFYNALNLKWFFR